MVELFADLNSLVVLTDEISLPGGVCVWLTAEKRGWLSGRYYVANWDVEELLSRKKEIVEKDLFKMRLTYQEVS